MSYTLEEKLERIDACSTENRPFEASANLLHAYVACLTFDELCEAICLKIEAPTSLRLALRNRLLRLLRLSNGEYTERLSRLLDEARAIHRGDHILRTRVDALFSAIYPWLPIMRRQEVLENWADRGTSSAAARWLKASSSDDALFDPAAILTYWRQSGDVRASKILAYHADPLFLREIIGEFATHCPEGWIVSKAALRAKSINDEAWKAIRQQHPASFAYLCAMTHRELTDDEALQLLEETMPSTLTDDKQGLVIWAIGQLGMVSVLDRLVQHRDIHMCSQIIAISG